MKKCRKKTSIIWTLEKSKMVDIVGKSSTIKEILNHLGFNSTSGNGSYKMIKARLKSDNIDYSHIPLGLNSNKGRRVRRYDKIPLSDILIKNSSYNRGNLKKRLVKEGILTYECVECGCDGSWNGKTISLQLDHINGVHDDNRLSNLRFLCPNCHAATDTFCGKHKKLVRYYCIDCGKSICKGSTRCKSCAVTYRMDSNGLIPDKDKLTEDLKVLSFVAIGKKYGVSDNGVRKWCKRYDLPFRLKDLKEWMCNSEAE